MKRPLCLITVLLVLAACTGAPTPVVVVPTLAALPSETPADTALNAAPSPTSTDTPAPSATATTPATETATAAPSDTPPPTDTDIPPATATATLTASATVTDTPTPTVTWTYTPSLTITNTITPLPSPTFTPSQELSDLGLLALLSERATILPPERLYNPPTLTAVAYAAQTLIAGGVALTPAPSGGGTPAQVTLPPASVNCTVPPPAALAADPTVVQSLGCPVGGIVSILTAVQSFEHGSMIYVQGSPGSIYVLTIDGRFRRFDDTWVSGSDPETGGETPPLGLIEPKRGFGKVWRNNLDVRGSLGWGVTEEQGATTSVQLFDRGRAIFMPQRGETYLLIDDPGGTTGTWRALPGGF